MYFLKRNNTLIHIHVNPNVSGNRGSPFSVLKEKESRKKESKRQKRALDMEAIAEGNGKAKLGKANVTISCQLALFVFNSVSANKGSEQRYFKSPEGSQHSSKKYANRPIWNQSNIRTPLYIRVSFPVSIILCLH